MPSNIAAQTAAPEKLETETPSLLIWRVHLLRRNRSRLPVVGLTLLFAALCIRLIFGAWLPAGIAVVLLTGAVSDYLFPITYRITDEGVFASGVLSHFHLPWKEVRRAVFARSGVLLSPFAEASRLDSFRGVFLRFAPAGEPGNRNEVQIWLKRFREAECAGP